MPSYKVNNTYFNIPDDEVDLFEADFPEAELQYKTKDGQSFAIPANEKKDFLLDFPDATDIGWKEEAPKSDLVAPQYGFGEASYEENVKKMDDGLYYPSPLNEEGMAETEPMTAEDRAKQEYDMLTRHLNEFNALNGEFMDTYEAYEKAADAQIAEMGISAYSGQSRYLDENRDLYLERKAQRDELAERLGNNWFYNESRRSAADIMSDAANSAEEMISQLDNEKPGFRAHQLLRHAKWLNPVGAFYRTMVEAILPDSEEEKEFQEYLATKRDLKAAERFYRDASETYAAPVNNGKDVLKNFGKGFVDPLNEQDFWTMGLTGMIDNLNAREAFQKIQDKFGTVNLENLTEEEINALLTPSEQILIDAVMDNMNAHYQRKDNTSGAYEAGQGAADSAMFMAQFLLTQGIGSAVTTGTKAHAQAVKSLAKGIRAINNNFAKSVARGAAKLTLGTAESLGKALVMTPLMPHTYANIADKIMSFDENGKLTDITDAILTGAMDSLIETWSESTGDFVEKVLGVPGAVAKKLGAKELLKKVPFGQWGASMNAPLMKILRKGGFNGFLGEMGEEFIGNAVRSVTIDPNALKNFVEGDNLLVTAGSFLPMTVLGLGGSSIQYGKSKRNLENAQKAFENTLRNLAYTEDQIKFAVDELLGTTDAYLTPEKLVNNFKPILRELQQNDRVAEDLGGAYSSAVKFMSAIAQYRTFDGIYHRQQEQQITDMQNEIQEATGREFWNTRLSGTAGQNGTAYETNEVRAVEFADGRIAYVLGNDGVSNAVVYNDGQTGSLSEEQINEGKVNGKIVSDSTMGLRDYLTQQISRVRMNEEEIRMYQERNTNLSQIRAQFPVGATVEFGTEESPQTGFILSTNADGAVVQMPDNTTPFKTWDEIGNTIGVRVQPLTDAESEEEAINNLEIADLQRRRERERRRAEKAQQNTQIVPTEEEMIDEAINESIEHPIPMKADGTVDQDAFWNESPERWAQWKTEQRQDGGAYAASYIQNAINILSNEIAANEQAFAAESNFDKKDALEQVILKQKERLDSLVALSAQYAPAIQAEAEQTQAPAEEEQTTAEAQTQAPVVLAERERAELDAEYQRRLSLARTLAEKEMILKEYFDAISSGSLPVHVVTEKNYKEVMKKLGCSQDSIDQVKNGLSEASENGGMIPAIHVNNAVWVFAENIATIEQGRTSYVHERQHNITKNNPSLIARVLALGLSREQLADIVYKFSGSQFYSKDSAATLANEILSFAMEVAYTYDNYSVPLSASGMPQELINLINEISNEQREDLTLVNARRSAYADSNAERSGGENDANQTEVSGGLLESEGDGSVSPGERGTEAGESGEPTEGEVDSTDKPDFRVVAPMPEDNLSDETKKELAEKDLIMEGGAIMSNEYAQLKHETGYQTPIEREAAEDAVRFSVVTKDAWAKNYMTYPEADKRVVEYLERLAQRITANELVNEVVSHGKHKSSKKTKDGKLVESGPLRSNISYVVTFDLDTTCPRTFQYLNFVKRIEKRIGRPLTQVESIQLTEMMRMYGQQIPCVYCYAENKRQAMKQYFTNFINSRHAVLSAATDEEALQHMYGHEAEGTDPKTVLTEAAYKVFTKWRTNPKGTYNPTMRMLWNQYTHARNSVLTLLDMRYAENAFDTNNADSKIASMIAAELGVKNKVAIRSIEEIVAEWKWNTIESKPHDDFSPVEEDDIWAHEGALEVWRDMTLYAKSASGAKNVNRYTPYTDELKNVDQATRDHINGMGGVRMHSTNDFRIDYVFDYFQFMADMAANKMFGHTYTKSPEFVRIFGNSGYKINMSIAAYQDENGKIRPNVDEGFDWTVAQELRKHFPNAGTMLMATSDEQLQMALDSDWIDMCIPFHHSGLAKAVWGNMRLWTDYTSVQNEQYFNTEERLAMLAEAGVEVPRKASTEAIEELFNEHFNIKVEYGKDGKRVKPHFLPGPTKVNGVDIPGHNNDHAEYLRLCREYGVKPRFKGIMVRDNTPEGQGRLVDITEHPRYMILVKETARTDTPQTAIQFNFDQPSEALGGKTPLDYAFEELETRAMAESELAGGKVKDIYTSLEQDQFGIVEQFLNTIIKHKNETGEDYPLDYLTPESREWFLVQRKALEEAFKDIETIPYHRNEYDEQGNLVKGKGLEKEAPIDLVEEAKKSLESEVMYRFIGELGAMNMDREAKATTMMDYLEVAREMEQDGKDAKAIKAATGWERGAGGKWRYETEDFEFKGKPGKKKTFKLSELVKDTALFAAYPQLKTIKVKYTKLPAGTLGEVGTEKGEKIIRISEELYKASNPIVLEATKKFAERHPDIAQVLSGNAAVRLTPEQKEIFMDEMGPVLATQEPFIDEFGGKDTLVHEIQHVIQGIEGFAEGGNSSMADTSDPATRSRYQTLKKMLSKAMAEANALTPQLNERKQKWMDAVRAGDFQEAGRCRAYFQDLLAEFKKHESRYNYIKREIGKLKRLGSEGYKKLAGEVEARNAETRINMTAEERRNSLFSDTQDVATEDQLFLRENIMLNFDEVESSNVSFRAVNENQAIFVSNAAKAVEGIKQEKATPEQWLKMIEKNGGLKAGEDKWMGLSDFLKTSDKKTLTKQEVLDFINENMIIINEVHYGARAEESAAEQHALLEQRVNERYKEILDSIQDIEDYDEKRTKAFEQLKDELDEWGDYVDLDMYNVYLTFPYEDLGDYIEMADIFGVEISLGNPIYDVRLNYTTDGLNNKREIALTVPTIESWNESDLTHFGDAGDGRAVAWVRFGETTIKNKESDEALYNQSIDELNAFWDSMREKYGNGWQEYMSEEEKLREKEIVAKYRQLRKDNYRKVLVIDEIQSKRHQEGREKGYKKNSNSPAAREIKRYFISSRDAYNAYQDQMAKKYGNDFENASSEADFREILTNEEFTNLLNLRNEWEAASLAYGPYKGGIPDAPFDKNWHELAMKRMLRYAAENGYDVIAWTKGDQQAERYNIGSYVSSIEAQEEYDGNRDFGFYMGESDEALTVTVDENGTVVSAEDHLSQTVGRPLADLVGKEMAVKMMQMEEYDVLEDTDLKVGNEGMKGFYDKMLPAFMNKYGKKWGIKVEDIDLSNLEDGLTMHSVPVTEEMKSSVMEGQVMFRAIEITPEVQDEMNAIHASAIVMGNYLKAPNGKDTNLTPGQWLMVRTKKFKEWFGNWINDPENASKVVDENGEPMVVYHGTNWNIYGEAKGDARFISGWFTGLKNRAEGFGEPVAAFLNLRNPAFNYDKEKDKNSVVPDDFDLNNPKTFGEYDGYISYVDYSEVPSLSELAKRRIKMLHPDNYEEVIKESLASMPTGRQIFSAIPRYPSQIKSATDNTGDFSPDDDVRFSVRTKPAPKNIGVGYKVFYLKNGKLYPPMVANLGGVDTPVGVWLDAEEGVRAGFSKTGRPKVKAGGKGTQGGGGTLSYRPGWHLGEIPYALQFRRNDENGEKTLFPGDFVWAKVEYANDIDYQEEAMSYGYTAKGNFQHSLAGLPKLPTDGSYRYRTNPNPETDPWIITGAMKVVKLLTPSEVDGLVREAGREPQRREEGAITDEQINALNKQLGLEETEASPKEKEETVSFRVKKNLTEEEKANALQAINRRIAEVHQNREMSPKSNLVGNPAEPLNNEYSPASAGAQGASLTAKQAKKLVNRKYMMENLADFIVDFPEDVTLENFAKRLYEGLGLNTNNQDSDYAHFLSANNVPETIRLSNHSGNSRNIIVNGVKTSKGYSIVIRLDNNYDESKKSNHLDANSWADVNEFVYIAPDRERMQEIAKTLFNLLDVDEYVDLAKAEKHYVSPKEDLDEPSFRFTGTPTEDVVAEGVTFSKKELANLAGDIFSALPEDVRKKITDSIGGDIFKLQDAIMQIPASLASKEEWNDEDKAIAEAIAELVTNAIDKEMTRPLSASEALWMLYDSTHKPTDLVSEASRALVKRNLGFDEQTLALENEASDEVRFRTVGDASINASASLYNKGAVNAWTRLKEVFVDMYASVEKFVKSIEKASGKPAEGFEDVRLALNQQSSKGLAAMEKYERKYLKPMFAEIHNIMKGHHLRYEDVVRYVILKHGLERNDKFAKRDAKEFYRSEYEREIAAIDANQSLSDADKQQKKDDAKKVYDAHVAAVDAGTDAKYKELRKNDFSGISSMFYNQLGVNRNDYQTEEEYQAAVMAAKQDKYSTLEDIEDAARAEVDRFEQKVNTDELWRRINASTKEILRQQYQANMISKDQYDNLTGMFDFYVPLRGFADNTAEDMYTYYRKPNANGYTRPILGAEGRKTQAESPFGWIAAMAGSAIASNVKNEAKLALYYLVSNRPDNGVATISRTWFMQTGVDASGKKIFSPTYPPFTEDLSSDAAKQAYEDWQKQMRDLRNQGMAYESGQKLNLGNAVVSIDSANQPEHVVNVKVGGKDYTILINGNPRAAQAINGDLNIESTKSDYTTVFGPILRWMSSVNTSYNPEFWATNMMRDMLFTLMSVSIKEDPAYRRRFAKNYGKAFKVIKIVAQNENGTLGNDYLANMYKDFVENGGVTGYTQIKDSEIWEKEIENYFKSHDAEDVALGVAMSRTKDFFHAVHRFGESLEQVSRFAAFLTAREMGKSMPEAINDAKEITVNFNRKGSGKRITWEEAKSLTNRKGRPLNGFEKMLVTGLSWMSPLGRRTIMFFNAAIQGLNATYKLWKKDKIRSTGWALGYATIGVMNALLHSMLDDDDDYLDIPQYERRNSFMLGMNGFYIKWALPQEARAFYALGDLAVETALGRNPHQYAWWEALKTTAEVLPINPTEGWKAFMPSVAIPAIELMINEDYKGAPIYNEQKWLSDEERKRTAKWAKAYKGTGRMYVDLAKALNSIGGAKFGGDEFKAGLINLQPEKIEHIVQSAFGGTIRTADKFFSTIMAAIDPEEEVTMRQFPFLNRLVTITDERYKNVHVNDVFDYYVAEAEHANKLAKDYKKAKQTEKRNVIIKSDEYKWYKIYSKYKKPIEKIQEKIKAAAGTSERMELVKQQDELKKKMIKEISEL